MDESDKLLHAQKELERWSLSDGVKKFRARQLVEYQQNLLQNYLEPLAQAIGKIQEEISNDHARAGVADFALLSLGAHELALATLVGLVESIAASRLHVDIPGARTEASVHSAASRIGRYCRAEFLLATGVIKPKPKYKKKNPQKPAAESPSQTILPGAESYAANLERFRTALLRRNTNPDVARARADNLIQEMCTKEWWIEKRVLALGCELIEIACNQTMLFEFVHVSLSNKLHEATKVVRLSETGNMWLKNLQDQRVAAMYDAGSLALPVNQPMLVRPKMWQKNETGTWSGGYLLTPMALVKSNPENYIKHDFYKFEHIPEVISAVNTLQSTAWKINQKVLDYYASFWNQRKKYEKLFIPKGETHIPKALQIAIESRICHYRAFSNKRLYFPFQLDFRGRVYAVSQTVSFQADDGARGLLQFADSCAVSEESEMWMAIHTANCYGIDKVSFSKRHQWAKENTDRLRRLVADPFSEFEFLSGTKEPWAFLAAAIEYISILDGAAETWLPVYVDGRCNGLQHLSAISRDETAARTVNLLPTEVPQDLYGDIAIHLSNVLGTSMSKEAEFWRGKIDRDLIKKPVMTTPYGVTPEGILSQLEAHTKLKRSEAPLVFLRDRLNETIESHMKGPYRVKRWLQDVARSVSAEDRPIKWTSAIGFPVRQDYRKPQIKRLKISGFTVSYHLPVDGNQKPNKMQQANAIVPNYVHSMDASHLMKVVNRLAENGINHVGVIHDSFGVHCANVSKMNRFIREEFLEMYRDHVLEKLIDEVNQSSGLSLPYFHKYGNLDISEVLKSDYFFA